MFTYHIPTKVYFGKGQLENLGNVAKSYGKKVLLVYGGGSIKKQASTIQFAPALKIPEWKFLNVLELSRIQR